MGTNVCYTLIVAILFCKLVHHTQVTEVTYWRGLPTHPIAHPIANVDFSDGNLSPRG